jgi:hypothetical protein
MKTEQYLIFQVNEGANKNFQTLQKLAKHIWNRRNYVQNNFMIYILPALLYLADVTMDLTSVLMTKREMHRGFWWGKVLGKQSLERPRLKHNIAL